MKTYKTIVSQKYRETGAEELKKYGEEFLETGFLEFRNFVTPEALKSLAKESVELYSQRYRSSTAYNIFVDSDDKVISETLRNKKFITEKGCICYDQIPEESIFKILYKNDSFKSMLCDILGIEELYPYADNLAGININYYENGDALDWHYDNCNFTITLLVKKARKGGIYEYFPNNRYKKDGEEDYTEVEDMINGKVEPERVDLEEATLVIFRGTESLHRVTPILEGQRILVTLCYNLQTGISLSETSRKTFFGRID